jgi:hypothetical protein
MAAPRLRDVQNTRDSSPDLFDVPAAVVCTQCGSSDCPGCSASPELESGIVQIVPWERAYGSVFARLWTTASLTTFDAPSFFARLPDGPLAPALRFAFAAELVASLAMTTLGIGVAFAVAPGACARFFFGPETRGLAARLLVVGIPALATLLVAAHAVHGVSIDIGARRAGGRPARNRALRFGLYACGWDVVMGPVGVVVVGIRSGIGKAFGALTVGAGLPTRAAEAFLSGHYRLSGAPAKRAVYTSYAAAAIATTGLVLFVVVAVLAIAFF